MDCNIIEQKIESYLDGELTLSDRRDLEEHFTDCSACSAKLEHLRSLQSIVQAHNYAGTPASLKRKIKKQLKDITGEDDSTGKWFHWLGFGSGAAALGAVTTWAILFFGYGSTLQYSLADEILSAHVHSLLVDHVVDIESSDRHNVKPWFSGRIDYSPPVQDLTTGEFELFGARLDYVQNKPVSVLVYKRRAHIINVFILKEDNGTITSTQLLQRQGYNLIHWSQNGLEYWAVSDLNQKELNEIVQIFSKT